MKRGFWSVLQFPLFVSLLWLEVAAYADSLTLINDSNLTLSAEILDANGTLLEQVVLDAQDTSTWSLDYEYFGYDAQPSNPQVPYSVNWYCLSGDLFGTCYDVPSDSSVNALSAQGAMQCGED